VNRSTTFRELACALVVRRASACAWAFVVGLSLFAAETARASTDTQNCLAAISSAAGKFAQCRYKAEATYFKRLDRPKRVLDRAKCSTNLHVAVARAYERYGSACPDLSTSTTTQAAMQDFVTIASSDETYTAVESELVFTDNWTTGQLASSVAQDISVSDSGPAIPHITAVPTGNPMVTTEGGGYAIFTVVLDSQPTANVTIPIRSYTAAVRIPGDRESIEGTVSPSSLTFTPENWNIAQIVTVTGVDDSEVDGDRLYHIGIGPASSTDLAYEGMVMPGMWLINLDNDGANATSTTTPSTTTTSSSPTTTTIPTTCGVSSKCIFVTNSVWTGDLGGLAGADAKCNTAASTAGLPGTYVAWLSTGTTNAVNRVTSNGPYRTTVGGLVANNLGDLTNGVSVINIPIDKDEHGAQIDQSGIGYAVWTNTGPSGTWTAFTPCSNWTSANSLDDNSGWTGHDGATDWSWTFNQVPRPCNFPLRLYCFQQ